jgi:hypothetical protein
LPPSRGGSVRSDGEGDKDVVALLLTTCRPPRTLDGSSDVNRSCAGGEGGGAAGVAAAAMIMLDDEDAAAGFLFGGGSIFLCARLNAYCTLPTCLAQTVSRGRARILQPGTRSKGHG